MSDASPVIVNAAGDELTSSAPNWILALSICDPAGTGRFGNRKPVRVGSVPSLPSSSSGLSTRTDWPVPEAFRPPCWASSLLAVIGTDTVRVAPGEETSTTTSSVLVSDESLTVSRRTYRPGAENDTPPVAEVPAAKAAVPGPLTLLHAEVRAAGCPSSVPVPVSWTVSPTSATVSGPASASGGRLPIAGIEGVTSYIRPSFSAGVTLLSTIRSTM